MIWACNALSQNNAELNKLSTFTQQHNDTTPNDLLRQFFSQRKLFSGLVALNLQISPSDKMSSLVFVL